MTEDAGLLRGRLRHLEQVLAAREAELRAAQYELQKLSLSVRGGQWAEKQLAAAWSGSLGRTGEALWGARRLGRTLREQVRRRIERVRAQATEDRGESAPSLPGTLSLTPRAGPAPDLFCFPIIDWHFRFQRPQQLMTRLARNGHRVFWVAPWFRGSGPPVDVEPLAPGVWQVSLRGPDLNPYDSVPDDAAAGTLAAALGNLGRDAGSGHAVQIVEIPFWWPVARRLRERSGWPVLYDCMDDHSGFSFHGGGTTALEAELVRQADAVAAASRPLRDKMAGLGREAALVRNACDYGHFAAVKRRGGGSPVIGYYGAIADWFDSDLVADLAERRTDWTFVLIGSTFAADLTRLRELPNLRLVGERPYAELPGWLSRFDVAILPFRRIPLTEATNPVKAYEIMASGLPLVSVPLPEIVEFGDLVRLASTPAEFEVQIGAALSGSDESAVEGRRAFARQQTWEDRVRLIEELLPPRL